MELNFFHYQTSDELTDEDILHLYQIDQEDFPNPWKLESWQSFLATQKFSIFIYKKEKKIIAFSVFLLNAVDSLAHLLKIVTINSEKRKSYGLKLLEYSLNNLSKLGFSNFFLEVEISNGNAITLYKKAGFNAIHQSKNFYGTGKDALIMTLNN